MAKIPATSALNAIAQAEADQQGKALFEAGQYQQAVDELDQAVKLYQSQGNSLQQAAALANLSLVHQQLGAWEPATSAIAASLSLLQPVSHTPPGMAVLAQALEVQGRLQLNIGKVDQALATWQQAESMFQKVNNTEGIVQSRLNQSQALRSLGFYRRSLDQLNSLNSMLQTQPNSRQKAIALRNLGEALQVGSNLDQSRTVLEESLQVAKAMNEPNQIAAALLSLGNTARAQKDAPQYPTDAIAYYESAASISTIPLLRIQAQLNQLSLLVSSQSTRQSDDSQSDSPTLREARATDTIRERFTNRIPQLLAQLPAQLDQLPDSRATIYARINFAQTLLNFATQTALAENSSLSLVSRPSSTLALSPLLQSTLQQAIQQSRRLGDKRAESYSLGTLGTVYEKAAAQLATTNPAEHTRQLGYAKDVTQKALLLAQATNTGDIAYRWHWQLGRLLKQKGDVKDAIAAYDSAIANLRSLRGDLVSANADVQFNFRDSVEPIYRQSVDLLLSEAKPSAENLEKARQQIESLQLAELDNFFREACLEGQRVLLDEVVDQKNPTTTIVYPIVLRNPLTSEVKLQVIAKIPNQPLKRYPPITTSIKDFDSTMDQIANTLNGGLSQLQPFQTATCKVYDWLIQPMEQDIQSAIALAETTNTKVIAKSEDRAIVETLVFVLDDRLRQVPIAALWDGHQYLVERYSIALSPGLQLLDPKPIKREPLRVLAAGLSDPPTSFGFSKLPFVQTEIASITKLGFFTNALLEQNFTRETLEGNINAVPFNVVHLATHGQFSSNAKDTFILAADGPINVTQFDTLLRSRDATRPEAIELLVLSACQTAKNDNRATLGLAGFAVRSGARSTLASLTNVSDESTSVLMANFYQQLSNPKESITKAEALRRAQVALFKNPESYAFRAPEFWAPYILIGNWL
ncbi:CHAT domain-containing protein [Phormidium sp. CLA17]|nr:CHAT domain-containing protein [Leptolyngbya sp. Cla-17]